MADIIDCPSCQRRLKLPADLLGQDVRCPMCGQTFTAAFGAATGARPVDQAPPAAARRSAGPRRDTPPPTRLAHCPRCGAIIDRVARHCRRCNALLAVDGDEPRYWEPHRGGVILTLGILSALFGTLSLCCGVPALVGLGLGIPAWIMAAHDVHKMRVGIMDRNCMANTQSGQSYALVGVVSSFLCGTGYTLWFLISTPTRFR